jgi:UDP-N-acetylmuramyl pentapeptide phosphotransferase/UDP-N-acetylglucosamine-1-phosphate transferase
MNMLFFLFLILLSVFLNHFFCGRLRNTLLIDKPNARSLHFTPTIRGGGVIFIFLSLISIPLLCYFYQYSFAECYILVISITLLATIGFLDDLYTLSAKIRLVVQIIIAMLIILFMRPATLDFILFSFTNQYLISLFLFFAILWAINHFNFMDGLDGFCTLQSIFLFTAYAILFGFHHALLFQDFCFVLISTLIGFLIFNFPPAKLFMGDVGSATLGLITFSLALIAQQKYQIPIIYWFILNSLFLFDATVTLLRRVVCKEKLSAAHKKHAYQRIKQFGMSARVILLGQGLINLLCLTFVLLLEINKINLGVLLFVQFGVITLVYFLIEKKFPMYQIVY